MCWGAGDAVTYFTGSLEGGGAQVWYVSNPRPRSTSGQLVVGTDSFKFSLGNQGFNDSRSPPKPLRINVLNYLNVGDESSLVDEETATALQLGGTNEQRGGDIQWVLASRPSIGTLTFTTAPSAPLVLGIAFDGAVTYTPPLNFFGQVAFTFFCVDGADPSYASQTVTHTINVANTNDAPVINGTIPTEAIESGETGVFSFVITDRDVVDDIVLVLFACPASFIGLNESQNMQYTKERQNTKGFQYLRSEANLILAEVTITAFFNSNDATPDLETCTITVTDRMTSQREVPFPDSKQTVYRFTFSKKQRDPYASNSSTITIVLVYSILAVIVCLCLVCCVGCCVYIKRLRQQISDLTAKLVPEPRSF